VIFDGLTKNWRYPGWRVAWTLGPPKSVIDTIASAGSFLDGGGSRPCSAPPFRCSNDEHVLAETRRLHRSSAASATSLLRA
jgi:N-succinyldiaminopimelate aminotransferase